MSNIYLVRHGQAGTRDSYDSLSELGRRQSRLLGEHFVSRGIEFAAAYSGALTRQRQTAEEVVAAYARAGLPFPSVAVEPGWNEFDFQHVYDELAPRLCEDDAEFRGEYEEVREQLRASAGAHDAEVHRRWRPSDTKVVEAWAAGRYPYAGETWEAFLGRVAACRVTTDGAPAEANVVVFTSAVPAAVWAARALDISDGRVRKLAGVLQNSSYTVVRLRDEELLLLTFNEMPHLSSPRLRTRR